MPVNRAAMEEESEAFPPVHDTGTRNAIDGDEIAFEGDCSAETGRDADSLLQGDLMGLNVIRVGRDEMDRINCE